MSEKTNYIYLLKEREFIKTNENIYKIGKTKQENFKRFKQYPNGSILLFQMICNDCDHIENQVIKSFKEIFQHKKEIGNEYFEGDYIKMIEIIYTTITNNIKCITNISCNIEQTVVYTEVKDTFTLLIEDLFKIIPLLNIQNQHNITISEIIERYNIKIDDYFINEHFNYCHRLKRWMFNEDLLTSIGAQLKLGKGYKALQDRINKMLDKVEIYKDYYISGLPKKKRYTVKESYYKQIVEELEEELKHKDKINANK